MNMWTLGTMHSVWMQIPTIQGFVWECSTSNLWEVGFILLGKQSWVPTPGPSAVARQLELWASISRQPCLSLSIHSFFDLQKSQELLPRIGRDFERLSSPTLCFQAKKGIIILLLQIKSQIGTDSSLWTKSNFNSFNKSQVEILGHQEIDTSQEFLVPSKFQRDQNLVTDYMHSLKWTLNLRACWALEPALALLTPAGSKQGEPAACCLIWQKSGTGMLQKQEDISGFL